ncbi:MAG: DUF190 domain-containing protein [Rhodospirillales bacterium]|nr:DUF190 domain-containing protein [Rhodospirillales bacterium]
MHTKKKIEVIIEQPASHLVTELLDRHGATGYTVLSAATGRGSSGWWERSPVTVARQQVVIIAVIAPERAPAIIDDLGTLLQDFHGVVFVSEVEVIRSERF